MPGDNTPTEDAPEDPTISKRREVFEEHKNSFKHGKLPVYTPFNTRVKDNIMLLVEPEVVAYHPKVPQNRISHHLSSTALLEDLLEDSEYHGKDYAALYSLKLMKSLNSDLSA